MDKNNFNALQKDNKIQLTITMSNIQEKITTYAKKQDNWGGGEGVIC